MKRQILYSNQATKFLAKHRFLIAPIQKSLELYMNNPEHLFKKQHIKRLEPLTSGKLRLRVGDYRVVFTDDFVVILVEKIDSRGDVYKD